MPFGWGQSSQAQASPPSYTAQQHLQSFLSHQTFKLGTRRISDSLFETSFTPRADAQPYTLQISLPASFPRSPPLVTLIQPPLATHDVLTANMQCLTGVRTLSAWGAGTNGVTLVSVIEEIAQALVTRAPRAIGSPPPPDYNSVSPPQSSESKQESKSGSKDPDPDPVFHMPLPPVPSSFPDLATMPPPSLTRLLTDDISLHSYVSGLPCAQSMRELSDSVSTGNIDQARVNLRREEELMTIRAEVEAMKADLKERVSKYEAVRDRARSALEGPSFDSVRDLLLVARAEAEAESEDIAGKFMDGGIGTKEFVKEFVQARQKYHERGAKIERIEMQGKY